MHASSESPKLHACVCIWITLLLVAESETKSRMDYRAKLELAREHYERVAPLITCGKPRPKIFRVETTSMQLVPSATVLHRCGDHSGCCGIPTHKCVAKTKENVKLYFLMKTITELQPGRRRRKNRIRKFVFANHTECHCVDMSYKPR